MSSALRAWGLLVAWLLACVVCACAGSIQALETTASGNSELARPVQTPAAVEPVELAGITEAHNRVRRSTGAPPLRWSAALAATARSWANACVDVQEPRGMIDHNPGRDAGYGQPIGENIWATTAPHVDPVAAVDDWASEVAYYDRANNTCVGGACGHYTQLIWSGTRELGCGVGRCPRLRFATTLVCDYAPAGNIIGERPGR